MTTHIEQTPSTSRLADDPGYQALWALRIGFTALPILFGLDKFAHVMTNDWTRYLASQVNDLIPGNAGQDMHLVGIVEILAGIVVLVLPRLGGPVVAAWLVGVIVNLLLVGGYGDVAMRDFGLLLAALVLTRRAWAYPAGLPRRR